MMAAKHGRALAEKSSKKKEEKSKASAGQKISTQVTDATLLKRECKLYQTKIMELLKNPDDARKAALLIEKMLKTDK